MLSRSISEELTELHDTYTWEINAAVATEDEEFLNRLANEYTERALRVITSRRHAS